MSIQHGPDCCCTGCCEDRYYAHKQVPGPKVNDPKQEPPSVEQQKAELMAAGWKPKTWTIWKSPSGKLWLGPHGAWKAMKRGER